MKAKTAQEILTRLENAVQHDLIIRKQGRTGKSPKSIHLEALQELTTAIMEIIDSGDNGVWDVLIIEDDREFVDLKGGIANMEELRTTQRNRATVWLGRNNGKG